MHILMTADAVGGVWTYTRELVTGLLRRDHRVTLVSLGSSPTVEQTRWMQGLKNLDYFQTTYRLEWMQQSAEDIEKSAAWLQTLIDQVRPDLLHFNQYAYGALASSIPKIVVAHSDVISWWVNARLEAPPDTAWLGWYRDLVSRGLSSADAVVAPSAWMLDTLKVYYKFATSSRVIHNARNPSLFERRAAKEGCALTVGRLWDEGKQVSLLLKRSHSVPIYVAGSVDHPEKLNLEIADRNAAHARFLGPQSWEQLRELYARAAVYVGTSCYEPFGLAPLEAALSGCALLLNDIPSFRELWADAACYFDRNDGNSLSEKLQEMISNPQTRERFAARAFERAIAAFHPDRMLDSYERVYNSLVTQEACA